MPQSMPSDAAAMLAPRKATMFIVVSASITSAASSAEYSPSERPAVTSGRMPCTRRISVTPQAKATIAGWV